MLEKPMILEIEGTEYPLTLEWPVQKYLDTFYPSHKIQFIDTFLDDSQWDDLINKATSVPIDILERCNKTQKSSVILILDSIKYFDSDIKLIDMKSMSFGNFVDLDVYFSVNPLKYWHEILDILAPDEEHSLLQIQDLFKAINSFLEFRLWLYKQYKGLFGWNEKYTRDEDGNLSPKNISEIAGHWFDIICKLSNEDINKIDQTTAQPIMKVLNFLARKKDKDTKEMLELRKNKIIK